MSACRAIELRSELDRHAYCGTFFGTTCGQGYGSNDSGRHFSTDRARPALRAHSRDADTAMSPQSSTSQCARETPLVYVRELTQVREAHVEVEYVVTQWSALEAEFPVLLQTIRDRAAPGGARSSASSPARRSGRTRTRTRRCPSGWLTRRGAVHDDRGERRWSNASLARTEVKPWTS